MARRQKQNSNPAPAAAGSEDNATAETTVTPETPENDDDAVLAALDAADEPAAETTEDTVEVMETEDADVSLEPEDEDAVLAAVEAEEEDSAPAPAAKSGRKRSASKTQSAPVVLRQFTDVADHLDAAELKSRLDGINAKKVAEKAQNLVSSIETGKRLSGFTALAVRELTANGRVSGKSLVEAFLIDGKSLGTARAQAQQMTALFKALGIAQPDPNNGRELIVADNALVRELATLAA